MKPGMRVRRGDTAGVITRVSPGGNLIIVRIGRDQFRQWKVAEVTL